MPEYLRLWLSYNRRREPKKIELRPEQVVQKEALITANRILRHIKDFLFEGNESLTSFIVVWIESKGIRQNLFKLRKNKTELRLTLSENGFFELNVFIEDGSEKNNLLKNFQLNYDSYQRLKNNIDKVIQESKEEEKGVNQNSRPIDIAYFFADPLVSVSTNSSKNQFLMKPHNEVSYQVEYDQFIDMVKKEDFRLNFRVETMVATETNIQNTLIEGASLLHFACHGSNHGSLMIEHDKNIGELSYLTPDRFMDLLENKTLPKAIIFNVCYSYELAKRVSREKKIITIGYKGKAGDQYCEKLTKQFYMGLFRDGKSVRQIFLEIKQSIMETNSEEGQKLHIFPQTDNSAEEFKIAESKAHYKQYMIRWNMVEGLRGDDSLGVKKEMYELIQKLTNDVRMSYLFLEGDKGSGKTNLINKIRIYVLNRKIFTDQLVLDLRKVNQEVIETLFEMRLAMEASLMAWRAEMAKKGKETRVSCLVILDHAQKIIGYQYSELTAYIQEKLRDRIKYGKIVIITRKELPLSKKHAQRYSKASRYTKKPPTIDKDEFKNFIIRYWQPYTEAVQDIIKNKSVSLLNLVKAIKTAESPSRLKEAVAKVRDQDSLPSPQPKFIDQDRVFKEYIELSQEVEHLLKDVDIEVVENYHLYLSTILEEIANYNHPQKNMELNRLESKEELKEKKLQDINSIVAKFKEFYERVIIHQQKDAIHSFKKITRLSLKIAALCYLFDCSFERHLLNCEKMYVMANIILLSPFFEVPQRVSRRESQGYEEFISNNEEANQLQQLLKQYKLKVMFTLYTYYTECSFKLHLHEGRTQECQQYLQQKSKSEGIALDQLFCVIRKRSKERQIEIKQSFIKKYQFLNNIIQQLRYSPQSSHPIKPKKNQQRKNSDIGFYNDNHVQPLIQVIHTSHKKIQEYWRLYEELKEINSHFEILSKDSLVLMLLSLLKLINFNQIYLQTLQSVGQNYINREMQGYLGLYIKIMQFIDEDQIFGKQKSHGEFKIWYFPSMRSIKQLFRKYFRMYIDVYFHVEKLHQNITKRYEIRIFDHLLQMCMRHPRVKLESIKKDIESHKDQQFLSNYSCSTYIALPLLKFQNIEDNIGNRINLKRFESHIFHFQEQFFSTLDREIKHDIFSLNRDFFTMDQDNTKSLIQLLILNCSDTAVECESLTGKGQIIRIRHITCVPKAPVIILFGSNVNELIQTFRSKNDCSVLITIELGSDEHPNERDFVQKNVGKQNWNVKESRIQKLEQYANKLQIAYSVLQFFYTSFCKHFFTVDHSLFIEQVRNSYHLAKAEALMKTKIRLETGPNYAYSQYIKERIDCIDLSVSEYTLKQIRFKPAYHFMFKQYKLDHFARTISDLTKKEKRQIVSQIGCNREISSTLESILKAKKSCNYVYIYKSKEMLEYFMSSLSVKLKKYKQYDVTLAEPVVPDSLDNIRTSSSCHPIKSKIFDEEDKEEQVFKKRIMFFEDLKQTEFEDELRMIPKHEPITLRFFFSNLPYKSTQAEFQQGYILEDYNQQKIEFELFFIDCKARKPRLTSQVAINAFKKVCNYHSLSLSQIKREIQSRNH